MSIKNFLKLLIVTLFASVLLTGCVTDKAYTVGKTIYIGGKAVVIANSDLLDEETLEKLKSLDDKAVRYDTARTIIKKTVDGASTKNKEDSTSGASGN